MKFLLVQMLRIDIFTLFVLPSTKTTKLIDKRLNQRYDWGKLSLLELNMEANAIETVREYWKRMQSNDFAYAAELFSDEYVLDWPQSNERIRGKKKFTSVNEEYPAEGRWEFTINRIVGDEETVVTDVSITDGAIQARAITFTTIENGLIVRQVEYWPSEYDPPENRKHLVEPIK